MGCPPPLVNATPLPTVPQPYNKKRTHLPLCILTQNSQAEKVRRRLYSNRPQVTKPTCSLRRPFDFATMTADTSSAANGDTTNPKALANIPEEPHDDDGINAEEMDTVDGEMDEDSNLTKSHIIVRFTGDGKQINVAFLLKAVLTWLFEIDLDMYLETINPEWQFINSMDDFPTKEVEFRKCFDPTANRVGGGSSVAIGIHLFSTVSIGLMKKHNSPFMQYLKSKKISIKTSCGGSKNESTVCGLLGLNPDKTHRASITQQLHNQLAATVPDLAERKLLEKAKQILPFPGILPDFELQARWINADKKKYSAKAFSIVCASEHADFLRSLIVRAYFEGHVIGIGKLVEGYYLAQ